MNVIGLDLSLNGTGICIDDHAAFTVLGKTADGDGRLVRIEDAVAYYIGHARPALAVVEGLPFGNNDRQVALVHGAARVALARAHVPYTYIYPTTLKLFAVGDGAADKQALAQEAFRLGANPRFDLDQTDAWWLRRAGLAAVGQVPMTTEQAETLGHVQWPTIVKAYGELPRKAVIKKCRHQIMSLANAGGWIHPFSATRCDKPPR
jgi:Holliday junction resolvasome RuvABC endonuclease subunit